MKRIIKTSNAPAPIGPYNQAVEVNNTLYVSGQIAINPADGTLVMLNMLQKQFLNLLIAKIKEIILLNSFKLVPNTEWIFIKLQTGLVNFLN